MPTWDSQGRHQAAPEPNQQPRTSQFQISWTEAPLQSAVGKSSTGGHPRGVGVSRGINLLHHLNTIRTTYVYVSRSVPVLLNIYSNSINSVISNIWPVVCVFTWKPLVPHIDIEWIYCTTVVVSVLMLQPREVSVVLTSSVVTECDTDTVPRLLQTMVRNGNFVDR